MFSWGGMWRSVHTADIYKQAASLRQLVRGVDSATQICPTRPGPQLRLRPTQYFLRLSQLSIFPTLHSHNLSRISHIPIEAPLIYAQLSTFSTQPLLNSVPSQLSRHPTGSFLFLFIQLLLTSPKDGLSLSELYQNLWKRVLICRLIPFHIQSASKFTE